jgi:hypothetical protein
MENTPLEENKKSGQNRNDDDAPCNRFVTCEAPLQASHFDSDALPIRLLLDPAIVRMCRQNSGAKSGLGHP